MTLATTAAAQDLRGHGGPVRALAVEGEIALSGSFDTSAIVWGLTTGTALTVLRHHTGAVNAVAILPDRRFVTGGDDGDLAFWRAGLPEPERVIRGLGPIAAIALDRAQQRLAVASWNGTARVLALTGGAAQDFAGHQGPVTGVAFSADGTTLITSGADSSLRLWPIAGGTPVVRRLAAPVNQVATTADAIVIGSADGEVTILDRAGAPRHTIEAQPTAIVALTVSADGRFAAAAGLRGAVQIIDLATGQTRARLTGPGLPVWSLAFTPDGREILTGGSDRLLRRWDVASGRAIGPVTRAAAETPVAGADARGAEVFRACAACHTLTPDGGNRAGPTLHGIFGRRIATAPGYTFSEALRGMDIVWTAETISRLFEIGPTLYTPGTKMPEQIVRDPDDRAALIRFLEQVTR